MAGLPFAFRSMPRFGTFVQVLRYSALSLRQCRTLQSDARVLVERGSDDHDHRETDSTSYLHNLIIGIPFSIHGCSTTNGLVGPCSFWPRFWRSPSSSGSSQSVGTLACSAPRSACTSDSFFRHGVFRIRAYRVGLAVAAMEPHVHQRSATDHPPLLFQACDAKLLGGLIAHDLHLFRDRISPVSDAHEVGAIVQGPRIQEPNSTSLKDRGVCVPPFHWRQINPR